DPAKKKAQKAAKVQVQGEGANGGTGTVAVKPLAAVKKTGGADKPKTVAKDDNILQKSMQFLREVKIELKKVTWPTRKQTMGSTVVVIVLVAIISLFLGLVDLGLSSLVRVVLP
ncbi:MAG: preprotein translocase subunit SecE, partial [Desulfobacteraceae bacterium]